MAERDENAGGGSGAPRSGSRAQGKRARRAKPKSGRFTPPPVPEGWVARIENAEQLRSHVERLPVEPGVYVMRDREGTVVYVGKARNLRVRVRQYFSGADTRLFVPLLERLLGDIETIVTENDKEALLLENNLIKAHRPRFNVKLRDDKQYLVLRLDPHAQWPRLEVVRNIRDDAAHYFGPFHSAVSARATLRVVNRHFQLRTCTDYVLAHRSRPCLQYQIDRCPAPCVYEVDREAYADQVKDVRLFLLGRHDELTRGLKSRMHVAAEALEFETASRLRDQLKAIETTLAHQRVVGSELADQDIVGAYREGGQVEFVVMQVRGGRVNATRSFSDKGMELPDEEVLHGFLRAYFEEALQLPDELLLPYPLAEDDAGPLAAWLSDRHGRKVEIRVPERGDKHKLVRLACRNAASNFATRRSRRDDVDTLLARTQSRLSLSRPPHRIECFDISHVQGQDPVASMVVFVDGQPEKSAYRSFKIRGEGPGAQGLRQGNRQNDDFASMYEALSRRFKRALEAGAGDADDPEARDPWALPDLIVIDGGKGQLNRVLAAMQDVGITLGAEGVDVVSLAKERADDVTLGQGRAALQRVKAAKANKVDAAVHSPGAALGDYEVARAQGEGEADEPDISDQMVVRPERVFLPGARDAIRLRTGSSELHLMTRVRDEAHRFAITHHRKRRGKRALTSQLDKIPGVGPKLKKALIDHFGTIAAIREAEPAALVAVKGVGQALAQEIKEHLK